MDIDREIGIRMSKAGFRFLSSNEEKRESDGLLKKLLFFRELETLEFVFVTVVEVRQSKDHFEVALSRLKKLIGSLGVEDDARVSRTFSNSRKEPLDLLDEVIEFADLIASYDSSE